MNYPVPGWISEKQLDEARKLPESDNVIPAEAFRDKLVDRIHGDSTPLGASLPWDKTQHIHCAPAEMTIVAGIRGHGKSRFCGQLALGFIGQGEKVCVANMEQHPLQTLERLARMAAACREPSISDIDRMTQWWKGKFWLYNRQGTGRPERIEQLLWACYELGITHVFIDSLVKCGIRTDDYPGQAEFVNRLFCTARDTSMHVWLVHHLRKREGSSAYKMPVEDDIKGGGEILDQVDNAYIWWENQRRIEEAKKDYSKQDEIVMKEPEFFLSCVKARNTEKPVKPFGFWAHQESLQYLERGDRHQALPMIEPVIYGEREAGRDEQL